MKDNRDNISHILLSLPGLDLRCHCCGESLPLLHPHIMVERYDPDDNIICEACYEKYYAAGTKCLSKKPEGDSG